MNKIKVGQFVQDGSLIYLPLGFVPDWIRLANRDLTNTIFVEWWRSMETDDISGSQEGISITEGTTADLADDGGITAYDVGSQAPTIEEWTQSRSTAATARTATAAGTYIKPTTDSDTDRSAIFECVTAGTGDSSEPTWPDAIGEQVTDGTTVFERVDVSLERQGYQGVCIAGALMTDGQLMYYIAVQANQAIIHGDVVGWTDGVDSDAN